MDFLIRKTSKILYLLLHRHYFLKILVDLNTSADYYYNFEFFWINHSLKVIDVLN